MVPFESAARLFEELPNWSGTLTAVFGDGEGLVARADLLRLRRRDASEERLGEFAGYRTHEFSIDIDPNRREAFTWRRLFEYFVDCVETLESQFALGHDDDGILASLHSAQGLAAGLPGVYQMMGLGTAFVELIGAETLLELPASETRRLSNGAVAIRLDGGRGLAAEQLAVRAALGSEYFANAESCQLAGGGEVSLWSFVSAVLRSKRDAESTRRLAKRRPAIDWAGVYGDVVA